MQSLFEQNEAHGNFNSKKVPIRALGYANNAIEACKEKAYDSRRQIQEAINYARPIKHQFAEYIFGKPCMKALMHQNEALRQKSKKG